MLTFRQHMQQCAREYLAHLLWRTGGNISRAAHLAGRNRTDMYKILKRYDVKLPNRRQPRWKEFGL